MRPQKSGIQKTDNFKNPATKSSYHFCFLHFELKGRKENGIFLWIKTSKFEKKELVDIEIVDVL